MIRWSLRAAASVLFGIGLSASSLFFLEVFAVKGWLSLSVSDADLRTAVPIDIQAGPCFDITNARVLRISGLDLWQADMVRSSRYSMHTLGRRPRPGGREGPRPRGAMRGA